MTDKEQKVERYLASVKARGYDNLVPLKKAQSIPELIKEINQIVKEESTPPKVLVSVPAVPIPDTTPGVKVNPYIQAREKALADLSEKRRQTILTMEAEKDTTNSIYNDFARQVLKLGDELSNQ